MKGCQAGRSPVRYPVPAGGRPAGRISALFLAAEVIQKPTIPQYRIPNLCGQADACHASCVRCGTRGRKSALMIGLAKVGAPALALPDRRYIATSGRTGPKP